MLKVLNKISCCFSCCFPSNEGVEASVSASSPRAKSVVKELSGGGSIRIVQNESVVPTRFDSFMPGLIVAVGNALNKYKPKNDSEELVLIWKILKQEIDRIDDDQFADWERAALMGQAMKEIGESFKAELKLEVQSL